MSENMITAADIIMNKGLIMDVIIILILAAALFFAIQHIVRSKKKGKCAGCPYSGSCGDKSGCESGREK